MTANRSQQSSHQSIESLSQIYNQNLRLKFGSAPAQLITKGFAAEQSLEKRSSSIRKEIEDSNNVSVKSQLSQHISKVAERGTESPVMSTMQGMKSKSADFNGNGLTKSPKSFQINSKNNEELIDSSDDEDNNKKEEDFAVLEAHSNSQTSNHKEKSNIELPLLNLRSQSTGSSPKNNSNNYNKKKTTLVLPSIA